MSVCHGQQYLERNDVSEPQHSQPHSSPHTHHHRLLSHWTYCVYSHDSFKPSLRTTSICFTPSLTPQPNSHTNTHPFPTTCTLYLAAVHCNATYLQTPLIHMLQLLSPLTDASSFEITLPLILTPTTHSFLTLTPHPPPSHSPLTLTLTLYLAGACCRATFRHLTAIFPLPITLQYTAARLFSTQEEEFWGRVRGWIQMIMLDRVVSNTADQLTGDNQAGEHTVCAALRWMLLRVSLCPEPASVWTPPLPTSGLLA